VKSWPGNIDTDRKHFYQIRLPCVHAIVERGTRLAKAGPMSGYSKHCLLWLMMKLP
jgi:hypothetical protein